jgi:hypothetical protein
MYPAVSKRFRIGGAHRPLVSRNHGTCCRFYVGQAILPAAASPETSRKPLILLWEIRGLSAFLQL